MISAGRVGRTYGLQGLKYVREDDPRRKQKEGESGEEYFKRLKKIGVEELNKRHNKKIAKYAKNLEKSGYDDVFYKCPYLKPDRSPADYGAICKAGKRKLSKLLTETTDPKIKALIAKERLDEVTEEEFLSDLQRKYLLDYKKQFMLKTRVKKLFKVPDKETRKEKEARTEAIWQELSKFLQRHLGTKGRTGDRQYYINENYALLNGKIYQKAKNIKIKNAKREVTVGEFLSDIQNEYNLDRNKRLKLKTELRRLIRIPKNETLEARKARLAKLKEKVKRFLARYFTTPKRSSNKKHYVDRTYAFENGKIYKIANFALENECYDNTNGSVTITQDCTCGVGDGDVECESLREDLFPKSTHEVADGKIRAKIYFNLATKELRLLPDKKGVVVPKGFQPLQMKMHYPKSRIPRAPFEALQWLLSRHTDAKKDPKNGGKKILFDFLKLEKANAIYDEKTNEGGIYRNEDRHYVVDMNEIRFLTHYNTISNPKKHSGIYPNGVNMMPEIAAELIKVANKYKPLLAITNGVQPLTHKNFGSNLTVNPNGTRTYYLPRHTGMLVAFYDLVVAMEEGKKPKKKKGVMARIGSWFLDIIGKKRKEKSTVETTMDLATIKSLKQNLEVVLMSVLESKWRRESTKSSMSLQKIGLIVSGVVGGISVAVSIAMIFIFRGNKKFMEDPEGVKAKAKEKGERKARNKRLRRVWLRRKLDWIPGVRKITTEDEQQVKRDRFEKRRVKALQQISAKEKDARLLFVKGQEIFEVERDLLRTYPHWITTGWDDAIEEYHAALGRKGGEGAHPLVVGHSRSGKSYVHIGAFNHAAVDWLYRHEKAQIEQTLKEIFVNDKANKARWEKFATESNEIFAEYNITNPDGTLKQYPVTGEEMVKFTMARFKQISDNMPEHMRGRKSGIPDPSKMQAGTKYRGEVAERNAKLLAVGEEGLVPNIQEVYEALQQGKTSEGAPESLGNLLKHAMGFSDRSSYATGIQENMNVSADTTGVRGMKMSTAEETRDFNGRWAWIAIKPWNPKKTLAVMLDPGVHNNLELDNDVKIDAGAIEAAVRLGCKLSAPAGSGQLPRLVAWQYIAQAAARQKSQGVRGTFTLTADHVVEYAKVIIKRKIDSAKNDAERQRFERQLAKLEADPKKFGMEVMDYQSEHFMTPDEVLAHRDVVNKSFGKTADEGKLSRAIRQYILVRDPKSAPVVRKMALMIAANETIGDTSDPQEIRISRAVSLARRLYEIYEARPDNQRPAMGDTAEWTSFVNTNLEKVMPRSDVEFYASSITHEAIMRVMTPYKYHNGGTEPDLAHMNAVADVIKDRVMKLAHARSRSAYGAHTTPENLVGDIAMIVEEFEDRKPEITLVDAENYNQRLQAELAKHEGAHDAKLQEALDRMQSPNPAKAAVIEMLGRYGIREGTLRYHLGTEHMDPDKFEEKEFVEIVNRAAKQIRDQLRLGDIKGELISKNAVDPIAKSAISQAAREVRGPDDPDRDPTPPASRGPGGKPEPKGPPPPPPVDDDKPDPATESRMSEAEIKAVLPRPYKKFAAVVKAAMDASPSLYRLNSAARRTTIRSFAVQAARATKGSLIASESLVAKGKLAGDLKSIARSREAEAEARKRRKEAVERHRRRMEEYRREQTLRRRAVIPF